MSSVPIVITGVLFDKTARTQQLVTIMGEASLAGLGVGGGPIFPPGQPPHPGDPPGIWGGGNVPMPTPPIANVPGAPGYRPPHPGQPPGIWPNPPEGIAPHPEHPIVIPPDQPPPGVTLPPPGSPPVLIPGTTPTHPITPPQAIVVEYPGMGKVLVPQPLPSGSPPPGQGTSPTAAAAVKK